MLSRLYFQCNKDLCFELPHGSVSSSYCMLRPSDNRRDLIVLQLTGHLFFLFLFLLALVYWKERQSFDAGHYLLELINRKFFFIAHHRPVAVVSQVLPLAAIWLELPLRVVAVLYSIGDILWYYLIFFLLAHGLQTRRGIITLLLILSLTVRYTFFCPVTELLQALALIPVWQNLLERPFRFRMPLLGILTVLIIFSHPLLFYPLAFAFGWHLMSRTRAEAPYRAAQRRFEFFIAGCLLIVVALKLSSLDVYDHSKTFYPVVYEDYGYLKSLSMEVFLNHAAVVARGWPVMTFLFAASILVYLLRRQWKNALFLLGATALFLLIVSASHRFGQLSNYFERILLPVPAMIAIAASGIVFLPRVFIPRLIAFTGFVLVLLLHFDMLRITAMPYRLRIAQLRDLCRQAELLHQPKAIVEEVRLEQYPFAMCGWSTTLESLWLSALDGPAHTVTIAMQRDHIGRYAGYGKPLSDSSWIAWAENVQPLSALNPVYFQLPAAPYRSLLSYTSSAAIPAFGLSEQWPQRDGSMVLRIGVKMPENLRIGLADSSAQVRFAQEGRPGIILRPCTDLCHQSYFMCVLPDFAHSDGQLTLSLSGRTMAQLQLSWIDGRFVEKR